MRAQNPLAQLLESSGLPHPIPWDSTTPTARSRSTSNASIAADPLAAAMDIGSDSAAALRQSASASSPRRAGF